MWTACLTGLSSDGGGGMDRGPVPVIVIQCDEHCRRAVANDVQRQPLSCIVKDEQDDSPKQRRRG